MDISRRDLLKTTATSGLIAGTIASEGLFRHLLAQEEPVEPSLVADSLLARTPDSTKKGEMLYRLLGRTGQQVSRSPPELGDLGGTEPYWVWRSEGCYFCDSRSRSEVISDQARSVEISKIDW